MDYINFTDYLITIKGLIRLFDNKDTWIGIDLNLSLKDLALDILKLFERWIQLLETEGVNSKSMVMNDLQYYVKELEVWKL